MSQLNQLLQLLDRRDVTEIIVHTDKPVSVKIGDEYRPVSRSPVTSEQILALIEGTPIAEILPRADGTAPSRRVAMLGKAYAVRGARRGDILQVRIERAPVEAPDARTMPSPGHGSRPSIERAEIAAPVERVERAAPPSQRPPPPGRGSRPAIEREEITATAQRPVAAQVTAPVAAPVTAPVTAPAITATAAAPSPELEEILARARAQHASDVHIVADRPVQVRRVGELAAAGDGIVTARAASEMLLSLLTPEKRRALDERGYVDLSADLPRAGRLRVNISRQRTGLKGSFRLVLSPLPTLESLGLPQELARVTTYHQGLVVISGPSGHGKTTTLAAIVDLINAQKAHHIITIEDPVEFLHPRKRAVISQREVGTHTRSFATALKASLREDPDVIVIGELRDREAVEIAIAAAETGHLVIGTMSTPAGAKTIDRLIDVFPPADQQQVRSTLAGALKFVVAQRLLPTASGEDFVACVELISGTPPLWALIRDNKLFHLPNLQQRGRAFGMVRFDDSLIELFRQGKISEETALRYAENKRELAIAVRAGAPAAPAAPPAPAGPPAPGAAAAAAAGAQKLTDLAARVGKGLFGKRE